MGAGETFSEPAVETGGERGKPQNLRATGGSSEYGRGGTGKVPKIFVKSLGGSFPTHKIADSAFSK